MPLARMPSAIPLKLGRSLKAAITSEVLVIA